MRVSKTVREYIIKQVNAKMDEKYAALVAQEQATNDAIDQLQSSVLSAIEDLAETMFAEGIAANPAIQRADKSIRNAIRYNFCHMVEPVPNPDGSAYSQKKNEASAIVENIIVTLELGGTKADLERMLAEIV